MTPRFRWSAVLRGVSASHGEFGPSDERSRVGRQEDSEFTSLLVNVLRLRGKLSVFQ